MPTPATLAAKEAATAQPSAPAAKTAPAKPAPGEPCPKCGGVESWGTASWCPACGFYPRLGVSVGSSETAAADAESKPSPSSRWEALARLPSWAYVLAAGVFLIFFVSVAVRVVTPDDSFERSAWSSMQLLIGGLTFAGIHGYVFLRASMNNDSYSYWDIIVRPLEVWRPTLRQLPETAKRLWSGMWGLTAALCAVLIIGGIDYEALTRDWGFRERPKQNLMKQIKDQMMAAAEDAEKSADNLGDAVKDFAGDDEAKKKAKKKDSDLDMLSAECVVIGYNTNKETGKISELLLASVVGGKLAYVGAVSKGISPALEEQLATRLPELKQEKPLVKCNYLATWVKPIVTCRTSFHSWSEQKMLQRPVLQELLADVDAK